MEKSVQDNIMEILGSIPEYVTELSKHFTEVADLLRVGKDDEGVAKFSQGIDAFASLLELVDTLKRTGAVGPEEVIASFEERLDGLTRDIEGARELDDMVTLGDLCEFEVVPVLEILLALKWEGDNGK